MIVLDNRVRNEAVTRRIRVLKYRGSTHGTNEYPFLIDDNGFSVLPVTALELAHAASTHRVPSGVPALDEMLGGKGYFRGSSVLVTGTAGTGKDQPCGSLCGCGMPAAGKKAVFFAFEEAPRQIIRNMNSIGIDLGQWVKKGLLAIEAARPSAYGLGIASWFACTNYSSGMKPDVVAIDPISSLLPGGPDYDIHALVLRIVDFLEIKGTTGFFTALNVADDDRTATAISSLVDTWFLLRNVESDGERNRIIYLLKSRGMAHLRTQIRLFLLTSRGVQLRDVYLGPGGVLTGSARTAREIEDRREATRIRQDEIHRELAAKVALRSLEAQIASLEMEKEVRKKELSALSEADKTKLRMIRSGEASMRRSRGISGPEPVGSKKTNGGGEN